MKLLPIVLFCISSVAYGQVSETKSESKIDRVTVFLSGAQVHRQASVKLQKGDNQIRFIGLAESISQNSIQVVGQSSFKIVSVNHETNYLSTPLSNDQINGLLNRKKDLEDDLKDKAAEAEILVAEKNMILQNDKIAGETSGLDMTELLDIADYYRNRLNAIDDQLLVIERDGKKVQKDHQNVMNQLQELGYNKSRASSEIIVKISSERSATHTVEFSYIVNNAGWEPLYDVRSEDVTGPVELTYRGNVYQYTGILWDNVQLTLSTGNPSISGTKPTYSKWFLSNRSYSTKGGKRPGRKAYATPAYESAFDGAMKEEGTSADFTTVTEAGVSTEFKIDLPYTIPSDGNRMSVEIQKYSLPVQYEYKTIPRLDPDAFLISRVSGWDQYYLLSGQANIYYQGTFVGTSYIDAQTTQDTLTISLGRDDGIVVNRERVRDVGGTTFIGANRKTEVAMRVSIKNTKNSTIAIELEEQIPVSNTKEIEVALSKHGDAQYNLETGTLKWKLILGPGESRIMEYTYTVKSPKTMILNNI